MLDRQYIPLNPALSVGKERRGRGGRLETKRGAALQCLREFLSERAGRTIATRTITTIAARAIAATGSTSGCTARTTTLTIAHSGCGRSTIRSTSLRTNTRLALRRLSRIGAEKFIFERRTIKPLDDRLHLFIVGRFDKCEAFRFLCFGIANNLYGISDKRFRV